MYCAAEYSTLNMLIEDYINAGIFTKDTVC